jgi:hypothetical protein
MSVLVATTQFSEAYRAVTKDLESFMYGESLYRCNSNQGISDSSINTRRQNDSRYRIIASIMYKLLYTSNIPLSSILQITDRSMLSKIFLRNSIVRSIHSGSAWHPVERVESRCSPWIRPEFEVLWCTAHSAITNFRSLQYFFSL